MSYERLKISSPPRVPSGYHVRMAAHEAHDTLVLVVDDDEDIRDVLAATLTVRGYRVMTATDGDEALALLRSGIAPDIILLDLRMPGMSGSEFCREKGRDPSLADVPVLLLSGGAELGGIAASMGATDVLAKPVDLTELTHKIARYTTRRW